MFHHFRQRLLSVALVAALGCSGEEFSQGAGGTAGASFGGGGTAGAGGSGGTAAIGGTLATGATGGGGAAGLGGAGAAGLGGGAGRASADCGPEAGKGLLFYSTLDDAASISSPQVGSGTNAAFSTSPTNDFVAGRCGTGLRLDEAGEYLQLDESSSFSLQKGKLDWWYRPGQNQDDGVLRRLVYTSGPATGAGPGLSIRKTDTNVFSAKIRDTAGAYYGAEVSDLVLVAGQWIRITVTWDVAATDQLVRIYFDGVEANYSLANLGPVTVAAPPAGAVMYIGASDSAGTAVANGVFDDLKIYASNAPP